ncbi:MAG: hypothetical protein ABI604_20135 [Nitrospirota bacterium]
MSPHRIDIAERPATVAAKARLGDWEGDTIVGAQRNGALLTHVERKNLFTTISTLPRPTATATHRVTVHRLTVARPRPHHHLRQREGVRRTPGHRRYLVCAGFFATPYHA